MTSLVNRVRIASKDRAARREQAMVAKMGPTIEERQGHLLAFYEQYEMLVETLCDAAQYGPTPKLQRSYAQYREWMLQHYPEVRPFVVSYLRFSPEDAELGLMMEGRNFDAFEALTAAQDLNHFLQTDDGGMISRITRTREALNLYGEHLRQLAARTA